MPTNSKSELLSVSECRLLRGLAILGIVAHNYCHLMFGIVQENEFQWKWTNVQAFFDSLGVGGMNLFFHLFSFLGHYGVPVFLFVSAYGLERKYVMERDSYPISIRQFIWRHYLKLFKMVLPGLLVAVALGCWVIGAAHDYSVSDVFLILTFIGNLCPNPSAVIFPGVYWFLGLIFQFYVVYRIVIYRRPILWTLALMFICVVCQMLLCPDGDFLRWYRYNFMGNMLPFALGVVLARCRGGKIFHLLSNRLSLSVGGVVTILLLFLSCMNFFMWILAPIFVCAFVLCFIRLISNIQHGGKVICVTLGWFGGISAELFIWHPIVRSVVIGQKINMRLGFVLYLIVSTVIAWLFSRSRVSDAGKVKIKKR